MIIALLLAAALPPAPAPADPMAADRSRYNACLVVARSDPGRAIAMANGWRIEGGGIAARHCLGIAMAQAGDIDGAVTNLTAAATLAREAGSPLALLLWRQVAEVAVDGGKAEAALPAITAGLALAGDGRTAAPFQVLRARALVDLDRAGEAANALAAAVEADPDVPDGWLLKATLARRMGDLDGAEAAIIEAGKRTPDSAEVQYEAGTIAAAQGKPDLAKAAWTAAAGNDPDGIAGKAAAKALAALPEPEPKTP